MARRTAVRHTLKVVVPWPPPPSSIAAIPQAVRRVEAHAATACGLALTRRTRPRQSSSEEDARRLRSFQPEAGTSGRRSPIRGRSAVRLCPYASFGLVSNALTSANVGRPFSCLQLPSDHDCPCVTVVGRSLSHAVPPCSRIGTPSPRNSGTEGRLLIVRACSVCCRSGWLVVVRGRCRIFVLYSLRLTRH